MIADLLRRGGILLCHPAAKARYVSVLGPMLARIEKRLGFLFEHIRNIASRVPSLTDCILAKETLR